MTRRFSLLLITLLISIYFTNTFGCANAAPPDLATMVEEVRPGVVRIETSEGNGSGLIVDTTSDGSALVLTNYHVVEDTSIIGVEVEDSDYYKGYIEGFDADIDLAVLSICCGDFSPLTLGDVSSVKPGSEVIAIGYPLGLPGEASVTRGIVSAMRSEGDYEIIQMDAPINPGSSGGPLFSPFGEVLGINTFSLTETEGLGFAISERTIQAVLPQLKGTVRLAVAPTPTPTPATTSKPTPWNYVRPTPTPTRVIPSTDKPPDMLSPTATPFPTPEPMATPIPTSTPTPTPTLQPTSLPVPTATTRPTSTPLPPPAVSLTATPAVVRGDYFTRGSTQDDVLHAQGTPQVINRYETLGEEVWSYGYSQITFSLPDERVVEWANISGNLQVWLLPKTRDSSTPGYFTRGSSQDDVLHAESTPTRIDRYEALREEVWSYGYNQITFSLPDGRVREWDNGDGSLKIRLLPKTSRSSTPGYFTRGSSQDDVLHAQGTPTGIDRYEALKEEIWSYGYSQITFSLTDGQVTGWADTGDNLNVR